MAGGNGTVLSARTRTLGVSPQNTKPSDSDKPQGTVCGAGGQPGTRSLTAVVSVKSPHPHLRHAQSYLSVMPQEGGD